VVRVGLRRAPDPARELTYRLYFQEVPSPPAPGFQGLQVALRLGVPVFVNAPAVGKPDLRWSMRRGPGPGLSLVLANAGAAHVRVSDVTLTSAAGARIVDEKATAYLLAGQSREWPVKATATQPAGSSLKLRARTDAGEIKTEIALE
jgi:fimbrial chaperone protein